MWEPVTPYRLRSDSNDLIFNLLRTLTLAVNHPHEKDSRKFILKSMFSLLLTGNNDVSHLTYIQDMYFSTVGN